MSESLWSFEGTSDARPLGPPLVATPAGRVPPLTLSAVIAAGVHLFPFRTEKLSPPAPMVLGAKAPGRVGRRRISLTKGPHESVALSAFRSGFVPRRRYGRSALGRRALVASSARRRAHALRERRMRAEHPREPVGLERVDRVERLGRRRRRERRRARPRGRAGASASARSCGSQTRRRVAVGAYSRLGDSSACVNAAATGASTKSSARERKPPSRLVSISVVASSTANVCVRTSRLRMCASSWAITASSSSRRSDAQQAGRDDERGAAGPAADDERPREAVVDQAELRRRDLELGGDPVGRRAQQRILRERERPRVEHPEQGAVTEPVDRDRRAEGAEREQRRASLAADQPAEAARERGEEARPGGAP